MIGTHFRRRRHVMPQWVTAFLLVLAASLAVAVPEPLPSQSAEPSEAHTTADTRTESPGDASPKTRPVAMPDSAGPDTTADIEMLRRFNELRREWLDHREKTVDWWLAATAIFLAFIGIILTLLGIVAVIAGYFGFKRFHEIEAEAREYMESSKKDAENAKNLVGEIKAKREQAALIVEGLTTEAVNDSPNETRRAAESVQEDSSASSISQAVAAAVLLGKQGSIDRAIEKWRSIANVVDGIDEEIGAWAWFSVGYLHRKDDINGLETKIDSYDEAIRLKPDYASAYNNRGNAKSDLGRREEAIADYDEAIRLKPDLFRAYNNRGNAKNNLSRHREAIADYDEAIRLKPDYAIAYNNRGKTNITLNRMDEARRDFETAITLARDAGNEILASDSERALKKLSDEQDQ